MTEPAAGLQFPCAYPVKVMVESTPLARGQVLAVMARHAQYADPDGVRSRPSRNGRFESITITAQIQSRAQLEGLYQALRELEVVKMML